MTKQEMIKKLARKSLELYDFIDPQLILDLLETIQETHHLVEKDKVEVVENNKAELGYFDIVTVKSGEEIAWAGYYREFRNKNIVKGEYAFDVISKDGKPAINKEWVL